MKLGIVGKGGTGKTTVAALLAHAYAQRGVRVVAIDTDSNPNLGVSLGLRPEQADAAPELPRSAVALTSSAAPSSPAPGDGAGDADALVRDYAIATPAGPSLLTAMRVSQAGAGCTCGGHATVRSLLGDALEAHVDVTVIDMEAGLEHLSRSGGTLAHADVLLVVMEPSRKSVVTAARTVTLAEELGLDRVYGLGNKARAPADTDFFQGACADQGVDLAGILPYDEGMLAADRTGAATAGAASARLRAAIDQVLAFLDVTLDAAGQDRVGQVAEGADGR